MPKVGDGNAKTFIGGLHSEHGATSNAQDDDQEQGIPYKPSFITCHLCGLPQRLNAFYKNHLPSCLVAWKKEELLLVAELVHGDFSSDNGLRPEVSEPLHNRTCDPATYATILSPPAALSSS